MNRGMAGRLKKLETVKQEDLLVVIRRKFVSNNGAELPPLGYRDGMGNRWSRGQGESAEAFRARASADAMVKGAGRVKVLVPTQGEI